MCISGIILWMRPGIIDNTYAYQRYPYTYLACWFSCDRSRTSYDWIHGVCHVMCFGANLIWNKSPYIVGCWYRCQHMWSLSSLLLMVVIYRKCIWIVNNYWNNNKRATSKSGVHLSIYKAVYVYSYTYVWPYKSGMTSTGIPSTIWMIV